MRHNLLAAWYKSTEDLLNYCEPLLVYGDAKDSAQLALYVHAPRSLQ